MGAHGCSADLNPIKNDPLPPPPLVFMGKRILPSKRKKEILPLAATWMVLEGIMLSDISWTKKRQTLHGMVHMWILNKVTFKETESREVVARAWGVQKRREGW